MSPARWPLRLWGALLGLLLLGELAVRARVVSPAVFAAPSEIAVAAVDLFARRGFGSDVLATALRAVLGAAIGFPLGVASSLALLGLAGKARSTGELLLDFVRSIPITALIPAFIAIWGVGERNKVAIGAVSAMLVTTTSVWIGVRGTLGRFATLRHLYRPRAARWLLLVVLPASLPSLTAALRLSVSTALVLVVVAEMFVGTRVGIGKVINDAAYSDGVAAQYAAIVCSGVLGYGLNLLAGAAHRRVQRRFEDGARQPETAL